jgi:hypothetical protein
LVAANQHVAQLSEELQHAVFGNAGTLVAFRVGAIDAPMIAAELGMESPHALRETNNFRAWLRLMYDGAPLEPHLIETLPPEHPLSNRLHKVIARSRSRHMIPRSIVEAQIKAFFSNAPAFKYRRKPKRRRPDG